MDLQEIIRKTLPHVPDSVKEELRQSLASLEQQFLIQDVERVISRIFLKAIDGVIAALCATVGRGDAAAFLTAYLAQLKIQMVQLSIAMTEYAPKQLDVELAKLTYGSNSIQAKTAREERQRFIDNLRGEIKDVLLVALGNPPVD